MSYSSPTITPSAKKAWYVERWVEIPLPPVATHRLGDMVGHLSLLKVIAQAKRGETELIPLADLRFNDYVVFGSQVYRIKAMELSGKQKSISLEQVAGKRIAVFDPFAVFTKGVTVIR